jgi:hypothetical protein
MKSGGAVSKNLDKPFKLKVYDRKKMPTNS